jgi:hypothetical protein
MFHVQAKLIFVFGLFHALAQVVSVKTTAVVFIIQHNYTHCCRSFCRMPATQSNAKFWRHQVKRLALARQCILTSKFFGNQKVSNDLEICFYAIVVYLAHH